MSGEKQNLEAIETEKGKALVARHSGTPAALISEAIAGGADLEKLEKLLELQIRYEQNEAKKAYFDAMAAFKANPPKVYKNAKVDFTSSKGRTHYNYALLADAAEIINKALSVHGLSATWKTEQDGSNIKVTCKITHAYGHSEETALSAGPDNTGNKNTIQAIGSTVSYLERYTLMALTGLGSHEADDDGAGSEGSIFITENQANELYALIEDNGLNKDGKYLNSFLKWINAEVVEEIRAEDFEKAKKGIMHAINQTR